MDTARDSCPVCGVRLVAQLNSGEVDPKIIPIALAMGMDPAEYAAKYVVFDYEHALERHMDEHSKAELLAELMATRQVLFSVLRESVA